MFFVKLIGVGGVGVLLLPRAPGDFVFVLVGEQLVQVHRECLSQRGGAGYRRGLGRADALYVREVPRRVTLVLISGQFTHADPGQAGQL